MIEIRPQIRSALSDSQLQKNLRVTLGKTATARQQVIAEVANWEELRRHAHQVKAHTISRLGEYLQQLEKNVMAQGGNVVWADAGREALDYIFQLALKKDIRKVVKSKSMLGEEIRLNEELERNGIEPIETDLGEYIVQLGHEHPSHIVMPALHKSKEQVAALFVEKLGMTPTDDCEKITATARRTLRQHFLSARMGITGVNFGIAETGTIVVVENEGNARLSVSVPEVHVAIMGLEKVIPRAADLSVFLKLLTRNATAQKISTYVNLINGNRRPGELDGPSEFHLVLVDNGRTRILADEFLRQTLYCIRCGACLDVCPVYQTIGGHAYHSTYQGPIGAILTPQLLSVEEAPEHPFASSLCGACYEICPVKIEIPHILLKLREKVQDQKSARASRLPLERWGLQAWSWIMTSPGRYAVTNRIARTLARMFARKGRNRMPPLSAWTKSRELPELAPKTFRELFKEEGRES
ncbi:MAG: iron-sulfur cluster-binding protein [Acidobacteria bacterium]|nr:MAG: iron-sulfur cluster-binding protein [Acidobacteriota bacterium]